MADSDKMVYTGGNTYPQYYSGGNADAWNGAHNAPIPVQNPAPAYPVPDNYAPIYKSPDPVYGPGHTAYVGSEAKNEQTQTVYPIVAAPIGGAPMGEVTICGIKRRKFWIILCIGLFIFLAVGLGLGLGLGLTMGKKNSSGSNTAGGVSEDDTTSDSTILGPTTIRITETETETTATTDFSTPTIGIDDYTTTTSDDYTSPTSDDYTSTTSTGSNSYTTWTLPTGIISVTYTRDTTLGSFCAPTGYIDDPTTRYDVFDIEEDGSGYTGTIDFSNNGQFTVDGSYTEETDTRWSEWNFDFSLPNAGQGQTCDFKTEFSVTFRKNGYVWLNITNTATDDCVRSGYSSLDEGAICFIDYSGSHDFAFKKK